MTAPTAATRLVDGLLANGVDTIFGVPGESFLAVLDALYQQPIQFINARQEGGAAMMAAAQARLTGRPGICMVTRGPGATNACSGVHVAFQDSLPMILFIGQVARSQIDREAFQEIDYRRMFGQMAKWVAQIDDPSRMAEYVSRAFHVALSGRPGPVVLALPEDMLRQPAGAAALAPARPAESAPTPAALDEVRALLAAAQKPFLLLGGGGWTEAACADIRHFAEANALPVGVSFRCQDLLDNEHPNYAGHVGIGIDPGLAKAIRESDLLLVLGARLGEMTTSGYTLIEPPRPRQTLVHIHPDPEEPGRVYFPDLPIAADMRSAAAALRALGTVARADAARTAALHAGYLAFSTPAEAGGALDLGKVVQQVRAALPDDAIISNGAGNYAIWLHRFFRYRRFGTELAPTSGSMGFGTPAAVAAALTRPGTPVVAFSGDGCFMMTMQEFATAVQCGAKLVQIVVNNGIYGTIRMHQERRYPGRVSGTGLDLRTDFAALARALGGSGETVTEDAEFPAAFARALAAPGPALIELRVDPEVLTPSSSITSTRAAALAGAR
ncbi:Thiamine pyrophosphate-binding protein [Rhodovastum atsumiense]|uniref:Thiamine pyrophosphate-binding protein n=1 Tax=Rhodovastum atsumiense TaxID=504468 RepID=A0A5M6J0K5_9PROT|nr:thiamine pyrophosphate-binding protein [Rhodovastum atsumiense]KAA5614124.1 thiamine pyrophosphate-binding protein [Rhodovastum atsumiense]CAH2598971.1 Thiamine pyrophosphate-binding protein [Rhodovastum atsumiense]